VVVPVLGQQPAGLAGPPEAVRHHRAGRPLYGGAGRAGRGRGSATSRPSEGNRPQEPRRRADSRAMTLLALDPPAMRTDGAAWIRLSASALIAMSGVFLCSVAYTASRQSTHPPAWAFWVGSVLVVLSAAPQVVFSSRVGKGEASAVAALVALATYLIKFAYSPLALVFGDEFLHLQTAIALTDTGRLFTHNNGLPISPYYPGLELANTAISNVTGLSVVDSAYVLTAVLHVLLTSGLFALYHSLTGRPTRSLLAVVVYTTGGDYTFFNSYFSYETMGLAFVVLALWSLHRALITERRRGAWILLTAVFSLIVTVTHHGSSYFLLVLALALVIAHLVCDRRILQAAVPVLAFITVVVVVWDFVVASSTYAYISTAVRTLLFPSPSSGVPLSPAVVAETPGISLNQPPPSGEPHVDLVIEYAWAAILLLLLFAGMVAALRTVRAGRRDVADIVSLLAGCSVVAFAVRAISPSGGGELGTRLLGFFLIFGALPVSGALLGIASLFPRHRHAIRSHAIRNTASVGMLLGALQVGGIVSGWPPYFARLPAPELAGGRMRAINQAELAMSSWAENHMPAGSTIVADAATASLLGGYVNASVVANQFVAPFFLDRSLSADVLDGVMSAGPTYVVVNLTLIGAPILSGAALFPGDPFAGLYGPRFTDVAGLAKFRTYPWLREIYSDGGVEVFEVTENPVHLDRGRGPAPRI
jgi:hypothetical protein